MDQFQKFVLENGVRLIVAPMDTRRAAIAIAVKGGSQYEKKNESGISHFVEHYLFRGTRKLPDFRAVEEAMRNIQAVPHAHTNYEEVYYSIDVSMRHFEECLDIISDLLIFPTFKSEEMDLEREIIIQEMRTCWDRPAEYVTGDLWFEVCFGDQPAGRPIIGKEETVRSFTAQKLESYFKRYYVGQNLVIAVAGAKNIYESVPKLKKIFEKIKPGKARSPFSVKDNQRSPKWLISSRDTNLTHLYLGVKTPYRPQNREIYPAIILANIIGTRLYLSMVGDRGLAYERETCYFGDPTKSFLATYAGVPHFRVRESIRIILEEYRRTREMGVTNKELSNEINYLTEALKETFREHPTALTSFFSIEELYTGSCHSPEEEIRRFKSVTRKEVEIVAKKIFLPQNLNLALIGPHKDSKEFEDLLKGF